MISIISIQTNNATSCYTDCAPYITLTFRVWSSAGLHTSDATGPRGEIICITTHLTSFAVLVNPQVSVDGIFVHRVLQCSLLYILQSSETTVGQKALGIVSYIGCGISLACLVVSLLVFIIFG